jgi:hypothetical protein
MGSRKKLLKVFVWTFAACVVYVLSIGPVARLSYQPLRKSPGWFEAFYAPLFAIPAGPVTGVLDWYIQLWIPS